MTVRLFFSRLHSSSSDPEVLLSLSFQFAAFWITFQSINVMKATGAFTVADLFKNSAFVESTSTSSPCREPSLTALFFLPFHHSHPEFACNLRSLRPRLAHRSSISTSFFSRLELTFFVLSLQHYDPWHMSEFQYTSVDVGKSADRSFLLAVTSFVQYMLIAPR